MFSVLTLPKRECLPSSHSSAVSEQYDFQQIFYNEEKILLQKKSNKNVTISIPLQKNTFLNQKAKSNFRL